MKDLILGYLENHPGASNTPSALKEGLALDTEDSRVFRDAMDELQDEYLVFFTQKGEFKNREQAGVFEGKISIARNGMMMYQQKRYQCAV